MKKLKLVKRLILLILISPFPAFSQIDTINVDFPFKGGKIVYEFIGNVEGAKKEALYAGAKKWLNDSFTSGNYVIQMEDKDIGQIIGKATTSTQSEAKTLLIKNLALLLRFNIQINCKDDKARIRIYDITTENVSLGKLTGMPVRPMEYYASVNTSKFNPKQSERFRGMQKALNDRFNWILESFNTSISKAGADEF